MNISTHDEMSDIAQAAIAADVLKPVYYEAKVADVLSGTYGITPTGNASDMEEGGKPKKVIGEIFNKDKVIESTQAERVAKQQLGNDAVMKGWKIEAHNGKVLYYVTMHQDGKKVVVTVDAETGAYVEQSKSYKLPPEPDQGFDGRKTNLVWGSDIDMGR